MTRLFGFGLLFFFLFYLPVFGQKPFRLAVIGCHKQFEPAPALVKYLEIEPDLCLWIGDNVYADSEDDFSYIEKCYTALANKPAFQELSTKYPTIATWDDHDFGLNDAGKEYALKEQSKAYFRTFWELEDDIPADQDGIYFSRYVQQGNKTIQIILLDVRYNRDQPLTDGDVLGGQQWTWLAEELKKPADLRLVVSGFQILLTEEAGSETWAKFPSARKRLFDTIRRARAQHVLFLAGDQHYGEVSRMRNALDYDAVELQFAGINQIEDGEYNPLRVAPVITSKHSYAYLDIDLEGNETEVPHVLFQIYNAMTDELELRYRVNLHELETNINFRGAEHFTEKTEVRLEHNFPQLEVRYTLDGQKPTSSSAVADGLIQLTNTTTVQAALFSADGSQRSRVYRKTFTRLTPEVSVQVDNPQPGLEYIYFEAAINGLDELADRTPLATGIARGRAFLAEAQIDDHFALVYTGYIWIPKTGAYRLATRSDDGSRLYVHDRMVVDNDGSHSLRQREGLAALSAGWHPVRIEYFEDYSGEQLEIKLIDPEGKINLLTPADFYHSN